MHGQGLLQEQASSKGLRRAQRPWIGSWQSTILKENAILNRTLEH